jgi:MraZ protein
VNNFGINTPFRGSFLVDTWWGEVGINGASWGFGSHRVDAVNKPDVTVNKEPTYYNSLYRHGVDGKRRVQIPSKWRPDEEGTELTLMLWPKAKEGPCLRVLPPVEMAKLVKSIDAMSNADPNKVVLKRFIGSESVQVGLDKAGRICLPEEMAKAAGIEDEAVLVGLLDRFEIWNPKGFEKVKASDAVLAHEAFKLME